MAYPAHEVAQAFLAFCNEYGDTLTNLKLQKLLYYAQGWYLAMHDEPLFDEPLEAWTLQPRLWKNWAARRCATRRKQASL
jgi:uncharacterized phage-associated protein